MKFTDIADVTPPALLYLLDVSLSIELSPRSRLSSTQSRGLQLQIYGRGLVLDLVCFSLQAREPRAYKKKGDRPGSIDFLCTVA